ncbi:MAG: alpha/beta hydrolase [Verrucomicrobiales bacterium]
MRSLLPFLIFSPLVPSLAQQIPPPPINVWPADAGRVAEETVVADRNDGVKRITDIQQATITPYRVAVPPDSVHPAVLVFPGGGYSILAIDKEGTEIAEWLNRLGYSAFVVKYRVPKNREGAFADAQRAVRLVRQNAKEWKIDPKRIGVMGFSAGGHLCARLSTDFDKMAYEAVDEIDKLDCRPDFSMLIYPAYLQTKEGKVAPELPITAKVPPTFILQSKDDKAFVAGTIVYDQALKAAGVSSTFHLFESGGHGYGLRPSANEVSKWPALAEEWMKGKP